eukprot:scaffold7363_cov263-Pinguiococcus_pyrenoidosus.AAC.4
MDCSTWRPVQCEHSKTKLRVSPCVSGVCSRSVLQMCGGVDAFLMTKFRCAASGTTKGAATRTPALDGHRKA